MSAEKGAYQPVGALAPACDECGILVIDKPTHEAMHAQRRCLNCGHDSPHVQQYDDECFCGCVDYAIGKGDYSASTGDGS